jgi:hypothetical protein
LSLRSGRAFLLKDVHRFGTVQPDYRNHVRFSELNEDRIMIASTYPTGVETNSISEVPRTCHDYFNLSRHHLEEPGVGNGLTETRPQFNIAACP